MKPVSGAPLKRPLSLLPPPDLSVLSSLFSNCIHLVLSYSKLPVTLGQRTTLVQMPLGRLHFPILPDAHLFFSSAELALPALGDRSRFLWAYSKGTSSIRICSNHSLSTVKHALLAEMPASSKLHFYDAINVLNPNCNVEINRTDIVANSVCEHSASSIDDILDTPPMPHGYMWSWAVSPLDASSTYSTANNPKCQFKFSPLIVTGTWQPCVDDTVTAVSETSSVGLIASAVAIFLSIGATIYLSCVDYPENLDFQIKCRVQTIWAFYYYCCGYGQLRDKTLPDLAGLPLVSVLLKDLAEGLLVPLSAIAGCPFGKFPLVLILLCYKVVKIPAENINRCCKNGTKIFFAPSSKRLYQPVDVDFDDSEPVAYPVKKTGTQN